MDSKSYICNNKSWLLTVAMGIAVYCYFVLFVPFLMLAREQSQLFLWSSSYLLERLSCPGGLAQYLGELMVQFFYNPFLGGLWYVMLFVGVQQLVQRLGRSVVKSKYLLALSIVPSLGLTYLWTQIHIPMTLSIAVFLALSLAVVLVPLSFRQQLGWLLCLIPVGYWLIGPAVVLAIIPITYKKKQILAAAVLVLQLVVCVVASSRFAVYPLTQLARGVDYYWDEEKLGTLDEMAYDMMIRQLRWSDMVNRYQQHPTESLAIRDAVSVALWQTQQIDQQEMLSNFTLSGKTLRSISSAFLMSEVGMQVGMVSIAQRAAFEAMEAAPNYNKSARALRRLVETNLITGQPQVALKYIAILEQTTFYRSWAKKMRPMAEQPELVDQHPYYHRLKEVYDNGKDVFF